MYVANHYNGYLIIAMHDEFVPVTVPVGLTEL
jgi:hypothetical protein